MNARDKASNKQNKITISNDAGRLSQAEIDRMIEEAEKFKTEDDAQAGKVAARQEVQNYVYQVMDALENAALVEKVSSDELEKVEEGCSELLEWMEQNADAEKEVLDAKRKALEQSVRPLMTKMYQEKVKGANGKKKNRR